MLVIRTCGGVEGPGVLYIVYNRIALTDSQCKVYDEGGVNHLCPAEYCIICIKVKLH